MQALLLKRKQNTMLLISSMSQIKWLRNKVSNNTSDVVLRLTYDPVLLLFLFGSPFPKAIVLQPGNFRKHVECLFIKSASLRRTS